MTTDAPRVKDRARQPSWPLAYALCAMVASASASMQGDGVTADAFRTRATGLVDQGELGEAIDVATRAVELAPDDVQSWAVLAYVQLLARDNAQQARAAEDDDRLTGCE